MNFDASTSTFGNGHHNGQAHANGILTPLSPATTGSVGQSAPFSPGQSVDHDQRNRERASPGYAYGYTMPNFQAHNEDIVNHLYQAGFQTGNYADTILHVHQDSYRLHALVLSRSPYLAHLMSTSPHHGGQRTIFVALDHEPEVTQEGFAIALGYLYSAVSLSLVNAHNARAVLASACLLGGMNDLVQYAYETCRQTLSVENIASWLDFLDSMPRLPSTLPNISEAPMLLATNTVFGPFAQRLHDDVFHFLVVTLPEILDIHNPEAAHPELSGLTPGKTGREILLQIFSRVPFEIFKAAVESPTFHIGPDQVRFKFAKDAIALRKHGVARGPASEETVVLAFGGNTSGSSAVCVTRKIRKRQLWKVNS